MVRVPAQGGGYGLCAKKLVPWPLIGVPPVRLRLSHLPFCVYMDRRENGTI